MVLPLSYYGEPVLRKKGAVIAKLTPEIKKLIEDMLDTMHEARGVGLAAQQVGHALQLTVLDVRGVKDRPSTLEIDGKPVDVAKQMPLVLVNPQIKPYGDPITGPEGCLSFPEIYSDITRPEYVDVKALDKEGAQIHFTCGGLLSRAVQHEFDHLQGILFIDRMPTEKRQEIKPDIEAVQAETKERMRQEKR